MDSGADALMGTDEVRATETERGEFTRFDMRSDSTPSNTHIGVRCGASVLRSPLRAG